jgi:6-phosphogluconolactonase
MHPTLTALGLGALFGLAAPGRALASSCWVYFGTDPVDARSGIYRATLDKESGALSAPVRVTEGKDSEFFAFSPDRRHLYSLSREPHNGEGGQEVIESYNVDAKSGALTLIGKRRVDGSEACHISVDPSGRCVLTANYGAHYIEVFPVRGDFTVGERTCILHHEGKGPRPDRQESAHPHSINVDPAGKFAVVCDLGLDTIDVYRLDAARATLDPTPAFTYHGTPGAGPRHFTFHPDGKHAFVINELDSTIVAFDWDGAKGTLTPVTTVPILARDYAGPANTAAEVVVAPSGNFVYGSNRGDDSLVVHSFDPATGQMAFVQRITEGIKVPRNYAIDPSGRWLVCANLKADTATVYGVDPATGRLTYTGTVKVPEALCVRFLQP